MLTVGRVQWQRGGEEAAAGGEDEGRQGGCCLPGAHGEKLYDSPSLSTLDPTTYADFSLLGFSRMRGFNVVGFLYVYIYIPYCI